MPADSPVPTLSIVVPTFNERENIAPLVAALDAVLAGVAWELIVVDDDSPDRTWEAVDTLARTDPRVRCLRRVGRRGLSSAVIEGALVASADRVAVMDADFQHDERILPRMLSTMAEHGADLVVATRYAAEGGVGDWDARRAQMSDLATRIGRRLIRGRTSDPMSGFFLIRRAALAGAVHDLSQQGYKILLDIIWSSPVPLGIAEVGYTFRARRAGTSKLSVMVLAEYAFLLVDKLTRGLVPPRFVLFVLVGGLGVLVHLALLALGRAAGLGFLSAQSAAMGGAMVFNYLLNNAFTYRDRRLAGWRFALGLPLFVAVCSIGAIANVGVAELAIARTGSWSLSGFAGALMGAVFNFGVANSIVWGAGRPLLRRRGAR